MRIRSLMLSLFLSLICTAAHAAPGDAEPMREEALKALQQQGLFTSMSFEKTDLPADLYGAPYDRVRYAVYEHDDASVFLQIHDEKEDRISFALQLDHGIQSPEASDAIVAVLCTLEPDIFDATKAAEALDSMVKMRAYKMRLAAKLDRVNDSTTQSSGSGTYFTDSMMYELTDAYFYAHTRSCFDTP